jgi:hypothetical protein
MTADTHLFAEPWLQEIQVLRPYIATLEQRLTALEQANRQLREQLEEAQRAAARQAAPFRRPDRKKIPEDQKKKPGRMSGHPGAYRAVPASVEEQAEVPLAACPCCGGLVTQVEAVEQFIEEIPPVRPRVTRLMTYKGVCSQCGEVHGYGNDSRQNGPLAP